MDPMDSWSNSQISEKMKRKTYHLEEKGCLSLQKPSQPICCIYTTFTIFTSQNNISKISSFSSPSGSWTLSRRPPGLGGLGLIWHGFFQGWQPACGENRTISESRFFLFGVFRVFATCHFKATLRICPFFSKPFFSKQKKEDFKKWSLDGNSAIVTFLRWWVRVTLTQIIFFVTSNDRG